MILIKIGLIVAAVYTVASLCWLPLVAKLALKDADAPPPACPAGCSGGCAPNEAAQFAKTGPETVTTTNP